MNLLALDTSTDTLSIAVQKGGNGSGAGLLERSAPGGAQSSTTLIPLIRELMGELGLSFDELDLIAFGRGPGSFTGLRTACSVAQGLAFGARKGLGVPVLPVDSLLAVAEQARMEHGVDKVLAVLDARMDEVYAAAYRWDGGQWSSAGDYQLLAPQHVIVEPGFTVAGNAQAAYGERLAPDAPHVRALPTAGAMLRLAPQLAASGTVSAKEALPLYIRDKVAQTTAEREQARQAASGPQPA
ncbi:tRNA (adenosine(37)-N6)-threonylcarbamoyltransferase complex dimerization subunit type 1 TsaB [Diaphorobacter ruginosibacter]|uniref:tRNA (Adenosine(37)-N6)-threonylcarbamoyltransferase complex dimerization subunit type 1 TsaB n=1 Tax=Diaphorobacter ruginosibacter TaxID=1715720 RepID=A0A7G9RNE4_9BURK|nr:tRNA (adenosine(37)-N6)-threonylcarbamoyltransferase complex dimerization subunit type 1 TsaB [Diaphorobacter ruginosibacter]QNN57119.1 tRNA (adenosine(37)-N6)-threonylcarbamoyltransferase complex dimerization subunit type 1 TsaB [Diaphorobacter ruginosibacter]